MKNFKKLMALVIAAVMVVASMNAFAATSLDGQNPDSAITISGLMAGDEVNIYKVLNWVGDTPTAQTWGGWAVNGGFTDVIATSDALGNLIDSGKESGYTGITAEAAGDLSRSAGVGNATLVTGSPFKVADGADSITVSNVELGMYMAIITPKDQNTVYNPVFVSADYFTGDGNTNAWAVTSDSTYSTVNNAQAAAKKSTVNLDKTFKNDTDYNGDNGSTTKIGDTLTFTVKTTIPGYGTTFDHPKFVIKDTMDNLSFVAISSVTAEGLDQGEYTIAGKEGTGDPDATGYSVSLDENYLRTLATPTELTIVYTATVTEEAQIANIEKETNTVTLQFSHDPSTEEEGKPGGDLEYKKDKTNHYTFSIDADNLWKGSKLVGTSGSELIKISVDREGNPIYSETEVHSNITEEEYEASPFEGAVFTLYKVTGDWQKDGVLIDDVRSDASGRIKFEGLDAGKYILVEKSAPSGFIRDTTEHKIEITSHESMVKKVEYYDQTGDWSVTKDSTHNKAYEYEINELDWYRITFDGEEVATHTFMHKSESTDIEWSSTQSRELPASIHNTKGVELPSTGGMGTTLFYAIGAILVLGAGILLVSKRRMSAN